MQLKNSWPPFEVLTHLFEMKYVLCIFKYMILYIHNYIYIDIFVYLSKYFLPLLHYCIIIVRINIHNDAINDATRIQGPRAPARA